MASLFLDSYECILFFLFLCLNYSISFFFFSVYANVVVMSYQLITTFFDFVKKVRGEFKKNGNYTLLFL